MAQDRALDMRYAALQQQLLDFDRVFKTGSGTVNVVSDVARQRFNDPNVVATLANAGHRRVRPGAARGSDVLSSAGYSRTTRSEDRSRSGGNESRK